MKTVKINGVTLAVRDGTNAFVPTSGPYNENGMLLTVLAQKAVNEGKAALLIGDTGVGKTSAIRYLASITNSPLRRVNMNGSMTAEDFLGQLLIKDGTTYWKDGVLTECMRHGYWIVIDEVIGMLITWAFVMDVEFPTIFLTFASFRFFDIVKIWPASYFDKLHHGVGTITDDVISAFYAVAVTLLFVRFF